MLLWYSLAVVGAALALATGGPVDAQQRVPLRIPVEYHKLDNGLRVVLSRDTTAPIVTVAVYYDVGFRTEPKGRTGFAHLFEHLMFQGSAHAPKGSFDRLTMGNGGVLNGSTRFDFTNYFEIMPSHTLDLTLWLEADRMRSLAITPQNLRNQQDVVKNEVLVNVINQPYGGFPWLDLPQRAFSKWANAHNFYGDFVDLDAATLDEAQSFFRTYYAPNNAVIVISGDFEPASALQAVQRRFGDIRSAPKPPAPDTDEPRPTRERRFSKVDSLAPRPALAFGYQMPPRGSAEYYAMGIIDQLLLQGEDSWLYAALVRQRGLTGEVTGGINALLGNMFDYRGPMLWSASLYHDRERTATEFLTVIDSVIGELQRRPVPQAALDRAVVKMRAQFYDDIGSFYGFGRANLLAAFALFDGDPAAINRVEEQFRRVTPALVQRTAREYLARTSRTVLTLAPAAAAPKEKKEPRS